MARIPSGLTFSIIIAGASLAVFVLTLELMAPSDSTLPSAARVIQSAPAIVHWAAWTSLGWCVLATLLWWLGPRERLTNARRDLLAVMDIAVMACALVAGVIMTYVACMEILFRTVDYRFESTRHIIRSGQLDTHPWGYGLLDLGAIASVLLLSRVRHHSNALITTLFWTLVLAALWTSFLIPAAESGDTAWVIRFLLGTSVILAIFTFLGGWIEHRRRCRAWPDRLDDLLEPLPSWPGFRQSAGIVAATHLVVGCIVIHHPPIFLVALISGICMLVLASRRWEENLADSGLALITLAVVSLFMLFMPDHAYSSANAFFAEVFNRALIALAVMTWFWHWLASVWKQQLDNGQAWTTAGRLIRITERVGYLVAATGVLMAIQLAAWPKLKYVYITDMERYRWIVGLIGYGLLTGALLISARRAGKTTLAWLALLAIASAVAFILIRGPYFAVTRWWVLAWPLILAGCGLLFLLIAPLAQASRTRQVFAEPLLLSATFIIPVMSIFGIEMLRMSPVHMLPWLPAATLATLTLLYVIAAFRPGPRRFLVVAALCAGVGMWYVFP